MHVLVKTIALGIGTSFVIVVFIVVVAACRQRQKRKLGPWKRSGRLLRRLCGERLSDAEDNTTQHQGRLPVPSGLPVTDLYPREIMPLRSSNVIDNPSYYVQNESHANTIGDSLSCYYLLTGQFIELFIYFSSVLWSFYLSKEAQYRADLGRP